MTQHAKIVLQDAKYAISHHNDQLQSEWFRISWISVVTLLRAVGNVLKNVDSLSSPEMKRSINEKWEEINKSKPEPKIFWEFIVKERNRFLKNYKHGIDRSIITITALSGGLLKVDCGDSRGGQFSPGSKLTSIITSGSFEGRYEKEVAWEAYNWWEEYLNEIDEMVKKLL
ncbi:hypothetical protein ACFL60_08835 [Candidatus Omnitrophota bacterium]